LKSLESERDELRNNVEELRAALESETLQKVDCQNNLQSLREELEFQKKVHEEVREGWHRLVHKGVLWLWVGWRECGSL